MPRIIASVFAIFFCSATAVQAQSLTQATWNERIDLRVGDHLLQILGTDPNLPEPLTNSTNEHGYELTGSLTYGPPGPPQVTAHTEGRRDSTTQVSEAGATADGTITFQIRLKEISTPPVSVMSVPVIIQAQGTATTEGSPSFCDPICFYDVSATAYATVRLGESGSLFNLTISSTLGGAPPAAFDTTFTTALAPGAIVDGSMEALAHVGVELGAVEDFAKADAFVDPQFVVSDELIPGTSSKYSDFYEIEYGPGYWALGNPSPVVPTTWGKIKTLYSKP